MNLERSWRARGLGLHLGLGLGALACLGPNPYLDDATDSTDTDGDGDGDPSSGDGDGEVGDGDGDGEVGDGDGDPANCDNNMQDGDETDVDCGGSCDPCGPGGACLFPEDCTSMVCDTNMCTEPACDDEVLNGDELEVDCGGSCVFCAHSPFVDEFDDFEGSSAVTPDIAIFDDGVFAVMYASIGAFEYRARWFDDVATPMGSSEVLSDVLTSVLLTSSAMIPSADLADHTVYAVIPGQDMNSTTNDVFAIARGQQMVDSVSPIYQGPSAVSYADMILDGDIATRVYLENGRVLLRRYNYAINTSVGLVELANPDYTDFPAKNPTLARRNGVTVVAWVACDAMMLNSCDVEVRGFDTDWIQGAPVALGLNVANYQAPKVAIAADDRVGLTVSGGPTNARQVEALWLDPDLGIEGQWQLGGPISPTFNGLSDVAALDDGTFVFTWVDTPNARVWIRRFSAPDTPLVADVDDEAPWPTTTDPGWVRISAAGNKVAVVWTGELDGVYQAQGQVLSY